MEKRTLGSWRCEVATPPNKGKRMVFCARKGGFFFMGSSEASKCGWFGNSAVIVSESIRNLGNLHWVSDNRDLGVVDVSLETSYRAQKRYIEKTLASNQDGIILVYKQEYHDFIKRRLFWCQCVIIQSVRDKTLKKIITIYSCSYMRAHLILIENRCFFPCNCFTGMLFGRELRKGGNKNVEPRNHTHTLAHTRHRDISTECVCVCQHGTSLHNKRKI